MARARRDVRPRATARELKARAIAFAALVREGRGRLAVQEALDIPEREYYRLLRAYRRGAAAPET